MLTHGRFTAVDPLLASGKSANPQTFNRYVYVMNSPLRFTDKSGLQAGDEAEDIIVRIETLITAAGQYISRTFSETFSWGGQSVTMRERNPIPQNYVPTDVFIDPDSVTAMQMRRDNVMLNSISPRSHEKAIYPYGTPEDVNRAAETLGSIDPTGTYSLAWTSYRHSIGQAGNGELLGSTAMFGTNFVPAGRSTRLAQNLIGDGIARPLGSAAHHIIALADRRAGEARAILEKAGIDIDDAANGVFLPATRQAAERLGGTAHSTIHTNAYYEALNNRLRESQNVREELIRIRKEILDGQFPF